MKQDFLFHMTQGSNFFLNRTIFICECKLSPGHLPRLHQVCGEKVFFTTDGIVVENVVLISKSHFIFVFYSIYLIVLFHILLYYVNSCYNCKVLDVMTFILFCLAISFIYSYFIYFVTQGVKGDYICKV